MSIEGRAKKDGPVYNWDEHGNDSLPDIKLENKKFVDYLIKSGGNEAANEPFSTTDVIAKGIERKEVILNEEMLDELSAGLELKDHTKTGWENTRFDEEATTERLYAGNRDSNLASVRPTEGILGKPQPHGEITGSIYDAKMINGYTDLPQGEAVVGPNTGYSNREIQAKTKASASTWSKFKGILGLD